MENDPRFAFWCDACGWNVARAVDQRSLGRIERFRVWLARREARRLADDVIRRRAARPRIDVLTFGALAIALIVYAVTLGLVALGVALIVWGGGWPGIVFGLILVGLALVLRPRIPMVPGTVLGPAELPALFRLLDRIAAGVGTSRVDGVVLDADVNAAFGRSGLRRRRILVLGMPLFLALEPAERVALLGHEMGHAVNGDAGRLFVIDGAQRALVELWSILEPDSLLPDPSEGLTGYLVIPLRMIQRGVARVILGLAFVQLALCYRTSQAAEYHADSIACRLGGSRPTLALLARLYGARGASELAWSRRPADPIATIAARLRGLPDREIARLRRVEAIEGSRFDTTHPPTIERERVVSALPSQLGSIVLAHGESDAIDRELDRYRMPLGRELAEERIGALG